MSDPNGWDFATNPLEDAAVREAARSLAKAYVDKRITQDKIIDEVEKQQIYQDIQREILDCNKRILNLPYGNLEEQSAVVAMFSEHIYMQIMEFRDDRISIEEVNWMVNELQNCVQKMTETIDRIIKHEKKEV